MMTSGYNIIDLVQEAQIRWLKPGEVLYMMQNFDEKQLTNEPVQKPPSGSLFLFNKRVLRFFRKDGHSWRRKKDGRTVGEAHEHLKVGNVEALNCYYAHGEANPNFQRRSYWMLDSGMDHIVLVHYRDITMSGHSHGSVSSFSTDSSTLIQGSNAYASQFTQSAAAFSNFREPYDNTSSPGSIDLSSDVITKSNGTSPLSCTQGIEEIGGSPSFEIDQALRRIKEQLSLEEDYLKDISAFYSENEIPNESGFPVNEQDYGGMQDGSNNYASEQYPGGYVKPNQFQQQSEGEFCITSQQTSLWNDVLKDNGNAVGDSSQKNYVYPSDRNGVLLSQPRRDPVELQEKYHSGYTGANNNSSVLLPGELEDFKFPAYIPARNLSESYPDIYSTVFDDGQSGMPLESDSSFTIVREQKFIIREIAPEWGYASEPTKVLIIGTFTRDLTKRQWYCMFGETEVPAEIIQEGVLCCYAPSCLPGKVALCITSGNRESCSEIREFDYRDKPNNYINNDPTEKKSRNSEELLLLVRFVQMLLSAQLSQSEGNLTSGDDSWSQVIETLLDGSLESSNATDWLLEELLKDKMQIWLSSRLQNKKGVSGLSKREQGIIHMVSGLGFGWALNPILKAGVGVNFRDINGWTALHWAARFGREKVVAELLASGAFAGAVTDPSQLDPIGQTPASIAATCGHKGLAGYLSEISLTSHPSLQLQKTELSRSSTDIAEVNSISKPNLVTNEDLSLKDTLAAIRNVTQAAARIQSAFRAHSFRKRQQKEVYVSGYEYGITLSDIEGLSAASKLTFRNGNYYNAALTIQKKYRGWKGRKDFVALRQKVVKIQAHIRGHQVRKSYKVFCWAVGVVEKVVLRWRRKGVGLRGFKQELGAIDECEDEDIVKVFRKEKVDVSIDEAVSRVLSMVDSQQARQQYRRMLKKYQEAKAEHEGLESEAASTSQGDVMNM
ncbi:hypothetical protein L1987_11228 [Smallanthus sonchifolius]|uniref:Uncharacterized protein n=1 Tax=Smallanthus sonchifolius TaxID=185202 RepID=A0ACB9JBX1_9ASTR|nr:hypothetical protein L1987_11228 [Smallanthus sonchifolius]